MREKDTVSISITLLGILVTGTIWLTMMSITDVSLIALASKSALSKDVPTLGTDIAIVQDVTWDD
jgi:hypothetical protein